MIPYARDDYIWRRAPSEKKARRTVILLAGTIVYEINETIIQYGYVGSTIISSWTYAGVESVADPTVWDFQIAPFHTLPPRGLAGPPAFSILSGRRLQRPIRLDVWRISAPHARRTLCGSSSSGCKHFCGTHVAVQMDQSTI